MKQYLALVAGIIFCGSVYAQTDLNSKKKGTALSSIASMMIGKFSSAEQAKNDSDYYNISLIMYPIWQNDAQFYWLYVEQAVASMPDRPYRQRIYRLSERKNGAFESKVYELANPDTFIFSWKNPELYDAFSPSDLIDRLGCSLILKKSEGSCYAGSTNEDDCKSDFRGAAYATSIVTVCEDKIVSWDQGWSAEDQQVWGAEKGGYVFIKTETF